MKIQKLNQLAEELGRIPKLNIDGTNSTISKTSSLLESSLNKDIFLGMTSSLNDVTQLEQAGDILTQVTNHAEHSILSGSMLLRLIDPIREFSKGSFSAAIKKTAVKLS